MSLILFFFLQFFTLAAEQATVRVSYQELEQFKDLPAHMRPITIDRERRFAIFEVNQADRERLLQLGLLVEDNPSQDYALPQDPGRGTGIPGYPCYSTVDETFAAINLLAVTNPTLVHLEDIGPSWQELEDGTGDSLLVMKISNHDVVAPKPVLFITSGIHPRELAPVEAAWRFANYLVDQFDHDEDIAALLEEIEVHILLLANPDGRRMAEQGFSWRKNTNNEHCSDSTVRGVDLNRNFPFQWGHSNSCSSTAECNLTYRGLQADSEPETSAITSYLSGLYDDVRGENLEDPAPPTTAGLFLDIHSYGGWVLWPYGFADTLAPNGPALQVLGRKLAFHSLAVPAKASESFDTCGTTDDFVYGTMGVPAYTFEIGSMFNQSCDSFESIWETVLPSLLYAAKATRQPYMEPQGPDTFELRSSASHLATGQAAFLRALADDTRTSQLNGLEPIEPIYLAEYSKDQPHWQGAPKEEMLPLDGLYNETSEVVIADLDTAGLDTGSHRFYVNSTDFSQNQGISSATKLELLAPADVNRVEGQILTDTALLDEVVIHAGQVTAYPDPRTGTFAFAVSEGLTSMVVEAPGKEPFSRLVANNPTGTTETYHFQLLDMCVESLDLLTFESNGWTLNQDSGGNYVWDDSPDSDYLPNSQASLTSPALTGAGAGVLVLHHKLRLDPFGNDVARVWYKRGDGSWQLLRAFYGDQGQDFQSIQLPIPAGTGDLKLRFERQSDGAFGHEGWQVQAAEVRGLGAGCNLADLYPSWPEAIEIKAIIPYINSLP